MSTTAAHDAVWLTTAAVAAQLGIDVKTVRRYADAGRLPYMRLPSGHRRFRREAVAAMVAAASREGDNV